MRRLLVFLILFASVIYAQEDKSNNPSVELPDFVITGPEHVSVKSSQMLQSPFIPVISQKFIKPTFSPDQLEVKNIPNPVQGKLDILDSLHHGYNGYANLTVGSYTLPDAAIGYSIPFSNGLVDAYFNGDNQTAYILNSDKSIYDVGTNLLFNIDNDSRFIPGTQFKIHGNYGSSNYKFFASDTSTVKRRFNQGNLSFGFNNFISKYFNIAADLGDNISTLSDENFSESLLNFSGYTKVMFSSFNINLNAVYQKQYLSDFGINDSLWHDTNGGSDNALEIQPAVGLNLSNTVKADFGLNYSSSGNERLLSPYASVGIRLGNGISLFGEYNPHGSLLTSGSILRINPYFNASSYVNIFMEKKSLMDFTIKYEYGQYYQINAGLKYFTSDQYYYFNDIATRGKFDLALTNGKYMSAFIDALFHLGPYGTFYGTIQGNDVRDPQNKFVPYNPRILGTIAYGYDFHFGLGTKVNLFYNSKSYADIQNTIEVSSAIDLGLNFDYKFTRNFSLTLDFNNLIDNKNYKWIGYQEKPFEVAAGVSLKF
jgi:hypothetical protein